MYDLLTCIWHTVWLMAFDWLTTIWHTYYQLHFMDWHGLTYLTYTWSISFDLLTYKWHIYDQWHWFDWHDIDIIWSIIFYWLTNIWHIYYKLHSILIFDMYSIAFDWFLQFSSRSFKISSIAWLFVFYLYDIWHITLYCIWFILAIFQ